MPKLPADLPENWTQGQTISPNGTEVGLTEQYGYNYLMKQVNNTQTEVNGINEALPDVAQQATVEEINNKIGTESDADTQPTLFGRLAQLKNVLVEKLAEVLTKVTGIDTNIKTVLNSVGYVKSTDDRKYAAIMEGVAVELPTVKKGSKAFNGTYLGFALDTQNDSYFYVSTLYAIYKISKETLEMVKEVNYSGAEVFGCDDSYLYAAKDKTIIKFDKNTLSQVAISGSSIEHAGRYDGSILDGDYIYTTRASGIYYSRVDKRTLKIVNTNSGLGDSGNRIMAKLGLYIVVCPAGMYRLLKSDLNSMELVSSSATSPKALLCDSQYAYVLGGTKYQKFNVSTKEKLVEVDSSVTLGQYYNFDCQNDDFLFLVPQSGGKAKKISKTTLEVIVGTAENVSKVFFADNTYMYCAMSDGKPGKIQIAPESGNFNITGFKEV